jgi:hypothetical protein
MARRPRSEAGARAESELKYWGYHVGKQFAADGYPSDNPILMLLSGHSDLNPLSPKFGVNTKDIPADAWRVNALIMQLGWHHRGPLIARYCLPMDYETGQPISPSVIAEALLMSLRTYFRRLNEARDKFYLLSVGGSAPVAYVAFGACIESTT